MTQRSYSDETKAAAMAALLQGQSVSSVARDYQIPKGTVSNWKRQAADQAAGVRPERTQKERIGELLVEYLNTNLETLRVQAEHFADPEWLKKQGASELAVLHGVMTDKAVRLLEAMAGAGDVGDGAP